MMSSHVSPIRLNLGHVRSLNLIDAFLATKDSLQQLCAESKICS